MGFYRETQEACLRYSIHFCWHLDGKTEKRKKWNGFFYSQFLWPYFRSKRPFVSWHWQRLVIPAEMAFKTGRAGAGSGREGMERNEGWRITTGVLSRGAIRLCSSIWVTRNGHRLRGYRDFCYKFQTQQLDIINSTAFVNCKIMMNCQSMQFAKSCYKILNCIN